MYAHPKYVSALVEYIAEDFRKSRLAMADDSIGGMIVCDSSEQAREVHEAMKDTGYSFALILHDVDDKETRERHVNDFKKAIHQYDFTSFYPKTARNMNKRKKDRFLIDPNLISW